MDEQTQLLREIRDLLHVMAEPQLAERDKKLRAALAEIVGKSEPKAKAALLMDGSKKQADIRKEAGIDQAALSRMTTALKDAKLVSGSENPKLVISVPKNFFETERGTNGRKG